MALEPVLGHGGLVDGFEEQIPWGLSEAVLKKSKVAFGMLVVDRVARQCLNEGFDRSLSLATVQCEFA
jgi:hypothetical protein